MAVPNILRRTSSIVARRIFLREDGRSRWYDDYLLRGSSQYTILCLDVCDPCDPSVPGYTAVMTPRGQVLRGSVLSAIRTTSPIFNASPRPWLPPVL
ncbi:hypothetical protein EVAR_88204_1 [Eumeta japonica]|uniref:Uncharacterized protein n=1 Tax=Eumeta variegata TaxID=151549 RepID=A0A4C1WCG8_EUMVA|nr:hypothetical protein EVAR_88204_1 [Eumeta japonica]